MLSRMQINRLYLWLWIEKQISSVVKNSYYNLRIISRLKWTLSFQDLEKVIHAFITSLMNYCNFLRSIEAYPRSLSFFCCCCKSYVVRTFQGVDASHLIKREGEIESTSIGSEDSKSKAVFGLKSAYVLDRGLAALYQVSFLFVQSYWTCRGEVPCLYTLRNHFAGLFLHANFAVCNRSAWDQYSEEHLVLTHEIKSEGWIH